MRWFPRPPRATTAKKSATSTPRTQPGAEQDPHPHGPSSSPVIHRDSTAGGPLCCAIRGERKTWRRAHPTGRSGPHPIGCRSRLGVEATSSADAEYPNCHAVVIKFVPRAPDDHPDRRRAITTARNGAIPHRTGLGTVAPSTSQTFPIEIVRLYCRSHRSDAAAAPTRGKSEDTVTLQIRDQSKGTRAAPRLGRARERHRAVRRATGRTGRGRRSSVRSSGASAPGWSCSPSTPPSSWPPRSGRPTQFPAQAAYAASALLFITGGERFRAKLHLSILDELPTLLGRLLMAAAVVAAVLTFAGGRPDAFLTSAAVSDRPGRRRPHAHDGGRRLEPPRPAHRAPHRSSSAAARWPPSWPRSSPSSRATACRWSASSTTATTPSPRPARRGWARSTTSTLVVRIHDADVIIVTDGEFSERRRARRRPRHARDPLRPARRPPAAPLPDPDRPRRPHRLDPGHAHQDAEPDGSRPRGSSAPSTSPSPGFALFLMAPALGLIALAVRTEGPGVIFRQPRVGKNGHVFDVLKFRSMKPVDETESATNWSIANDDRVGPIGRLLRMTSLDEIPQLWNILRGDMSLVGPRPERPHFVEQFSAQYELLRPPAPRARPASPAWRRSVASAATPRSPTARATTTSTSRTGRSGSTSRSSCAPSPRSCSPRAADPAAPRGEIADLARFAHPKRARSAISPGLPPRGSGGGVSPFEGRQFTPLPLTLHRT